MVAPVSWTWAKERSRISRTSGSVSIFTAALENRARLIPRGPRECSDAEGDPARGPGTDKRFGVREELPQALDGGAAATQAEHRGGVGSGERIGMAGGEEHQDLTSGVVPYTAAPAEGEHRLMSQPVGLRAQRFRNARAALSSGMWPRAVVARSARFLSSTSKANRSSSGTARESAAMPRENAAISCRPEGVFRSCTRARSRCTPSALRATPKARAAAPRDGGWRQRSPRTLRSRDRASPSPAPAPGRSPRQTPVITCPCCAPDARYFSRLEYAAGCPLRPNAHPQATETCASPDRRPSKRAALADSWRSMEQRVTVAGADRPFHSPPSAKTQKAVCPAAVATAEPRGSRGDASGGRSGE